MRLGGFWKFSIKRFSFTFFPVLLIVTITYAISISYIDYLYKKYIPFEENLFLHIIIVCTILALAISVLFSFSDKKVLKIIVALLLSFNLLVLSIILFFSFVPHCTYSQTDSFDNYLMIDNDYEIEHIKKHFPSYEEIEDVNDKQYYYFHKLIDWKTYEILLCLKYDNLEFVAEESKLKEKYQECLITLEDEVETIIVDEYNHTKYTTTKIILDKSEKTIKYWYFTSFYELSDIPSEKDIPLSN